MPFKLYQGDPVDVLCNRINNPVHTVVTAPPSIDNLLSVVNTVRLHPQGSIWLKFQDSRCTDGSLSMKTEEFAITMKRHNWLVADKVHWVHGYMALNGLSIGQYKPEHNAGHINTNNISTVYRFVRSESWSDICAIGCVNDSVGGFKKRYLPSELMTSAGFTNGRQPCSTWWFAHPEEMSIFWERLIAYSCPIQVCAMCGELRCRTYTKRGGSVTQTKWAYHLHNNFSPGIVLDPFCVDGSVGVAALKLGRSFIGICQQIDKPAEACQKTMDFLTDNKYDPEKIIVDSEFDE